MIPTTPTTTTHARFMPNRAPVAELATRSPMSTNPPIADRTPRKTPRSFFIVSAVALGERLELVSIGLERRGDVGRVGEMAPANGDPHGSDVVARGVEQRTEFVAQGHRFVVRWLDRA